MNDLISRRAAIDAILAEVEDEDRPIVDTRWWNIGMTRASVIVHDMPSAQPELIRCKDCKWYEIYQLKKDGTDDRRYKPSYCVNLAFHAQPDWYCAAGARNGAAAKEAEEALSEVQTFVEGRRKDETTIQD